MEAELPQPRASVALALGVMTAIAVVVASAVVAWARLATVPEGADEPPGLDQELPAALADGTPFPEVPAAVAGAVEAPVVAAVRLDAAPDAIDPETCAGPPLEGLQVESAFLTPEVAVVSLLGENAEFGPGTVRALCTAGWQDGWVPNGSTIMPVEDSTVMGFGSTWVGQVRLPEGAAWLVQDRGGYRLAYPVEDLTGVAVSWQFQERALAGRPPSVPITVLDGAGVVLEESFLGF